MQQLFSHSLASVAAAAAAGAGASSLRASNPSSASKAALQKLPPRVSCFPVRNNEPRLCTRMWRVAGSLVWLDLTTAARIAAPYAWHTA
jgi:hypothetical protein